MAKPEVEEGNAGRGAVRFGLCAVTGLVWICGYSFTQGFMQPFIWTISSMVCMAAFWPSQEDGEALIEYGKGKDDD